MHERYCSRKTQSKIFHWLFQTHNPVKLLCVSLLMHFNNDSYWNNGKQHMNRNSQCKSDKKHLCLEGVVWKILHPYCFANPAEACWGFNVSRRGGLAFLCWWWFLQSSGGNLCVFIQWCDVSRRARCCKGHEQQSKKGSNWEWDTKWHVYCI